MKRVLVALLTFVAGQAFAQSPESVSGMVYREYISYVNGGSEGQAFLRSDGTYATIITATKPNRFVVFAVNTPEIGTYSYSKTGSNTARLTFTSTSPTAAFAEGTTFRGARTRTRLLVFSAVRQGSVTLDLAESLSTGPFFLSEGSAVLTNSAMRGSARASKPLILGFVVTGPRQNVLIRGIGPTLGAFSVSNPASDPIMILRRGDGQRLAENDNWGDITSLGNVSGNNHPGATVATVVNAFATTGAFALPPSSKDSVILTTLEAGAYTVEIGTASDTNAEVLGEVYIIP